MRKFFSALMVAVLSATMIAAAPSDNEGLDFTVWFGTSDGMLTVNGIATVDLDTVDLAVGGDPDDLVQIVLFDEARNEGLVIARPQHSEHVYTAVLSAGNVDLTATHVTLSGAYVVSVVSATTVSVSASSIGGTVDFVQTGDVSAEVLTFEVGSKTNAAFHGGRFFSGPGFSVVTGSASAASGTTFHSELCMVSERPSAEFVAYAPGCISESADAADAYDVIFRAGDIHVELFAVVLDEDLALGFNATVSDAAGTLHSSFDVMSVS